MASIEQFTSKFQQALESAQSLALGKMHATIEPEHVLVAMLDQEGSPIRPLLKQIGTNLLQLRTQLQEQIDNFPALEKATGEIRVSDHLGRVLNLTHQLAQKRKDKYISSELFLLALLEDNRQVGAMLKAAGVTKGALETAITQLRGNETVQDPNAEDQRQALEKYTIDLTARAEQGKLDPVIGRDEEIRRTIQVLQRRTKNNPSKF